MNIIGLPEIEMTSVYDSWTGTYLKKYKINILIYNTCVHVMAGIGQ